MADIKEEIIVAERGGSEGEGAARTEVRIKIVSGFNEHRTMPLAHGHRPVEVLKIFGVERGVPVEELDLVIEGDSEPVSVDIVIDENYPGHKRHHVHHRTPVEVIIFYQNADKRREFRRHATVNDALAWAIKEFKIDPAMATEFELTRRGEKTALPGTEHIGHVAGHHEVLELDLVRGDIANGWPA